MAEGTDRNRDHLRAGIFVTISLALAIGTFLLLQRFSWTPKNTYILRFAVDNGVAGLSVGSEVRVGGLRRGRITKIEPVTGADGTLERIDVHFDLNASITLYKETAHALRVSPLLGNTAWINFTNVGVPAPTDVNGDGSLNAKDGMLEPGDWINAIEAPGLLANIAGSRSAADIVTIISRAEKFSEVLAKAPADYEEFVVPAMDAASTTVVQLRDDYQMWRMKVDAALNGAEAAARNLEDGTQAAKVLIADAHDALKTNRPKIDSALTDLESASKKASEAVDTVRTETIPKIAQMLSRGQDALGELSDLVDRFDTEIATELPKVRGMLDDARVSAAQLKLATIEIRRSPWRLFYRPSVDVLAHEQLYEATRAFALSSSELRTAADSMKELLRVRPELLDDKELQERLRGSLIDALGRYEEAQRRLHGVLLDEK
jgi:hypothetical protein